MEMKEFVIELTEDMLGTVAKDPEVYKAYIESKKDLRNTTADDPNHPVSEEDEAATVLSIEQKGWTGFHGDAQGLFVFDYFIKGFLKHAGNVLKDDLKVKNLRSKIDDFIFVFPRRIYLGTKEPHGVFERPIRVMTAQGPRVSLIRSDYVRAGTQMTFRIGLLAHKELTWILVDRLMEHGMLMGLGQFRNGSFGRFCVKPASGAK